jgi:glucan phosphorylase
VSYDDQPIHALRNEQQQRVRLEVWGFDTQHPNQEVRYEAEVYVVNRGGTTLYLFYCPDVFDVLYPDDATHPDNGRRQRFLQETIFAQCVVKLFKELGVVPDALLINEGHVAVAAAITRGDPTFDKTAILYTNHTVVSAGLEVFDVSELADNDVERARYIMRFPPNSWQWLWQKFIVENDGKVLIDFSKGALEICSAANAVSAEHARVTRGLFPGQKKHIIPVLNGTGDTWVFEPLLEMERRGVTPTPEQLTAWSRQGKAGALEAMRRRTAGLTNRQGEPICPDGIQLDPDKPTVWLVRRLVQYKSQYPILKNIIHVICAHTHDTVDTLWGPMPGLGMQVVVGGIAPQQCHEEHWIEVFLKWMQRPELKGRFVYVPGCDTHLLRWQAVGADICLNCPQPNKEACGTSDQRIARNGGINIAVYSGGPPEYLEDHKSGMLIGPYIHNKEFFELAPKDILDKLSILSEMYYAHRHGDPRWQNMKQQAYLASRKVTAAAMEQRYAYVYVQVMHDRQVNLQQEQASPTWPLEQPNIQSKSA